MESVRRTFTIEHCLGRGGFGEVYRAEMTSSTGLSTAVALKVLRRDVPVGGQAMQRLKDEGLMLARLNHPTILRVHDLVILEGRVSLVTEFVDGEDLERCLRGAKRIGPRALVELVGQVASALDAAYNAPIGEDGGALKLVHRDIKPSNLRISRHGEVKLLDFGIARSDEVAREARTMTNMMVGSPPYMAPERFLDAELRSASDVFGLGAIVLEGLIGHRVFDQPVTVLAALAVDRPRFEGFIDARFSEIPDDAPPEVIGLARQMLTYLPDERPTAAEVVRRCEALVDVVEGPSLTRWCRERRWKDPPRQPGDLDGRVVSEGTLARQTTPLSREVAQADETAVIPADASSERTTSTRTRGLVMWVGGASVLSTGVLLGGVAVAVAIGLVAWAAWPEPTVIAPIVVPAPPPEPVPVVAPVVDPPPVPIQKPEPETPARGTPAKSKVPTPSPPPPPLVKVPEPVKEAPKVPAARISAVGDASVVVLVRGSERIVLPGAVPSGEWDMVATFNGTDVPQGPLMVRDGADTTFYCGARFQRCTPQ